MDEFVNQQINHYCSNNCAKLKRLCNKFFRDYRGWITDDRVDDFISIAQEVVWQTAQSFDSSKGIEFETYLWSCIRKRFLSEIRKFTATKTRVPTDMMVNIDAPFGEEGITYADVLYGEDTVESVIFDDAEKEELSEKLITYLNKLDRIQRNVLEDMASGLKKSDIMTRQNLTDKEYELNLGVIRSFSNVRCLL